MAKHMHVLVTGANSGLGLSICQRLIDDFAKTQSAPADLTLTFTTRSAKKATATLEVLKKTVSRLSKSKREAYQYHFLAESVDLTDLVSVRNLARRLLTSTIPQLDVIILNAGVIGIVGLDWPLAIWTVATDPVHTLSWPTFKLPAVGLLAKHQLPGTHTPEPLLGEVFCANVFGHYLLVHWLMPLLRACEAQSTAKIIWTGSIEATERHYNRNDLSGLKSTTAYEHSKRLTDIMAITAKNQLATASSVHDFLTPTFHPRFISKRSNKSVPTIHLVHPGTCVTAIVPLHWIMLQLFILAAYFARLLGSPWCTVSSYPGALSATWLTLASEEEISAKGEEHGSGAAKWGSAVFRNGVAHVEKTDVQGWGINGSGSPFRDCWWGQDMFGAWGRVRGATDATSEQVESFVEDGARVWKELELLRKEWEARIEDYEEGLLED